MHICAAELGCNTSGSVQTCVKDADYVLMAVKPQHFDPALTDVSECLKDGAIVLSIAAAVTCERIAGILGEGRKFVRIMPNTPAQVGCGVSAVCPVGLSEDETKFVKSLLDTCGTSIICDEKTLDAIGCVSGTGPAYVMLFIEAMADAAVKLGIPRKTALDIAAMTVYGSGKLMVETGTHPAILKDQVCSPGGTTIEGVLALEKGGLRAAVEDAVIAADLKTKALAGGK